MVFLGLTIFKIKSNTYFNSLSIPTFYELQYTFQKTLS